MLPDDTTNVNLAVADRHQRGMRDDKEQPTASRDEAMWRPRHVGFERDGLLLGGLDSWSLTWRSVDALPLQLPHPAHPHQRHDFRVYQVTDGHRVARFAAADRPP